MKNQKLKDLLNSAGNRMLTVVFTKKNGDLRKLNGRFGVKKHLNGGENKNPNIGHSQLIIFDVQKKGYRTINLNTIKEVFLNNNRYLVNGDKVYLEV